MTVSDIRLACLTLADPKLANSDVSKWIERARQLEAYVLDEGQEPEAPPKKRRGRPPKVQAEKPVEFGPAKHSTAPVF
jgi:hypothetical protein